MTPPEVDEGNGRRASSAAPLSAAKMFGSDQSNSFRSGAADPEQTPAPFDGEDFLFHLYRGSELLQDNCVEQAKEELERALRMQPRDIEGQGLLGVVYFRLGLYPRAIEIYREIVKECPDEVTPKLNLALCYFKTGQPADARDLLEDVIRRVPDHPRAWGYLGLVFERLGDYAKAETAFERAGQPHLARRMQQLRQDQREPLNEPDLPRAELRRAAADAVEELEALSADSPFSRAESEPSTASRAGRWKALEPGEELLPPLGRHRRPTLIGRFGPAVPAVPDPTEINSPAPRSVPVPVAGNAGPMAPETFVRLRRLALSAGSGERTREGLVLFEVRESAAVRTDRLRASSPESASFKPLPLKRRLRGRESNEPFGGAGSSWCVLEGAGLLVLEGSSERDLVLIELRQEFVYLREARLVAFDSLLRFENGRLPAPEPLPMVQLAGEGLLVFEARKAVSALPVTAERSVSVRASCVLGWTGRLLGQAIPLGDSPAQGTGFVTFSGDGAVLVDDP